MAVLYKHKITLFLPAALSEKSWKKIPKNCFELSPFPLVKKNAEKHLKYSEGNQPKQINIELPPHDKVITIKITIQTKMPLLKLNYQSEKWQSITDITKTQNHIKSFFFFFSCKN